jgi:type I restriction enzyme, S subunit
LSDNTEREFYKLPESWIWVKTGDVCDGLVPGRTKPKSFDGDIPWITLPDIEGLYVSQSKKDLAVAREEAEAVGMKVMPKNTVLISCVGQFGLICIAANPVVPNQQLHGFVCLNQVLPEYVAYALKTQVHQMEQMASATTISYLNKTKCNSINFPLAPLNEQRRIVSTIEQLTDRSHKARTALEDVPKLIAQFRQSVLAAAFRGDLTADWREKNPDIEPASELLERIKIDRQKRWEEAELDKMKAQGKKPKDDKWKERYKETIEPNDSELRELPKSWCWTTLDQIMKKIVDGTHHTPTYIDSGTPFLSVKDIRNEEVYFDNCKYISEQEHNCLIERCNPEVGDLLVTKSGTIGRCAIIKTSEPFSLFVSVALLKPATSYLNIEYISLAFQSWLETIDIQSDVTGSAIKNFHIIDFRKLCIPFPPINEQKKIVELVRASLLIPSKLLDSRKELENELQQLDRSILAKAFRGELVPQDPNDEPAAVLLERIRAEREQTSSNKQRGKTTRKNSSKQLSIDLE